MAAAWFSASATAAAQSPPKPPANEDCLACHGDASLKRDDGRSLALEAKTFEASTHGPMACVDCHRDLAKSELPHEPTLARVQCGSCHDDIASKYHDSIHAWAKERAGLKGAPACADCHGAHDILPASDPRSTISKGHLIETCGKCHQGANAKFVAYDPHPDPGSYQRGAVLWWANRFYWLLIPGCFGFFALHSALWFWRARKESRP
jgi:nitrate/TMAO reductase-like tetraheme cytochrome c subunit